MRKLLLCSLVVLGSATAGVTQASAMPSQPALQTLATVQTVQYDGPDWRAREFYRERRAEAWRRHEFWRHHRWQRHHSY